MRGAHVSHHTGRGLALPASAGAVELRSGPLTATVKAEPFALEFRDAGDGDVLRTLSARAARRASYGALGYSFDLRVPVVNNAYFGYEVQAEGQTVWFHATRLRSARSAGPGTLVLDVATDDPLGHRLEVALRPRPRRRDHHRVADRAGLGAARRSRVALRRLVRRPRGSERYLGFGSRSNAVDQTGNRVFSWAEEGPFGGGEYDDEVRTDPPDFTFPTGPTTTNFPIPWLVSTRGLGFLIDQTERSTFDLLNERGDAWHAQAEAQRFAFTVFAGPRPADVVRRYSDYAGRQPVPRSWFFGPWVQFKDPWPERFRALDVPTTVAQTYTHYLPCGIHRGFEARERRNTARHHGLGYKITTYFNPHICTSYQPVYDDAARKGLLVKNPQGRPYLLTNPFTADQIVSEVDFTHPGGRDAVRTAARRGHPRRLRRLDGGLRRVHAHRRGLPQREDRAGDAQPLPGALPRHLHRPHGQARRRLRGVHPLRASTACSRTRGWSGAATPTRTGAAPTASARRCTRP